ncbi:odorant receptor 2a-like [Lasioglossum baleicum]|uniref:odorant receptor 2a-like n=1 Tax=Lasioglossum baleicum TaxID=434251 RepID=UPI003FCED8B0
MLFFITHVLFTTLHLFIDCYVGEALVGVSTAVAQSAYDCIWYNLPPKQSVSLIMLICRSRISFRITAGKFSPFSLERFNAVMRTSAGYLSVLLAMKKKLSRDSCDVRREGFEVRVRMELLHDEIRGDLTEKVAMASNIELPDPGPGPDDVLLRDRTADR